MAPSFLHLRHCGIVTPTWYVPDSETVGALKVKYYFGTTVLDTRCCIKYAFNRTVWAVKLLAPSVQRAAMLLTTTH
eukprot:6157812-Pleurochrysis_carterae.AAC.8